MERTVINAVLLILLISIIGALLFYQPIQTLPDIVKDTINGMPMYSTLAKSQREVANNISTIENLEQQIKEFKTQAETLEQAPVQKQYTSNDVDWKIDVPQLLIYLHKGAEQNKVELDINYAKANEISGGNPTVPEDPNNPRPYLQTPGGFINYVVPISVYGAYGDIINYIKYCDKTTFIVPYSMHIWYDEDREEVRADMALRVLYIK